VRSRRIVRFFWFVVSILLGAALGLLIGWSLPVENANPAPDTLRQDYQLDYVLMVAEVYQNDADLVAASRRLELLGADDILRYVQQATLTAQNIGYSTPDLELMVNLSQALALSATIPIGGTP
jgi:hypothetical protein